jgi:hypothetical protein
MEEFRKNLKNIIQGWGNYLFNNDKIKEEAERKASVCAECPLNVNNYCSKQKQGIVVETFEYNEQIRLKGSIQNGCGCFLPAKTRSDSKCPLGKF